MRPARLLGNFQIINFHLAKCLEKRYREIIESKLNDTQCSFRPGSNTTDHTSLSRKILRNLGIMLKISAHALSISRKHTTEVPCEKLWGVLRECGVDGRQVTIPAQKFVSVSGELNHDRSPLMLDSDKGVCCHRSFS